MKYFIIFLALIMMFGFAGIPHSYAACVAPLFGPSGPCFDSYMKSYDVLTEKSIMESYARNIELNYDDWKMSDRTWDNEDIVLDLPAIICTEFVADGMKQYRMAKWVDSHTISDFENHKDDSLCDKWIPPISDEISTEIEFDTAIEGKLNDTKVNYVDFRDATGEIIEVGCSLGLRASENSNFADYFLDFLKCNSIGMVTLVLALFGIITGVIFIVWRKRK